MAQQRAGALYRLAARWLSVMLLNRELDRWRRLGRRPVLWWRDDDARAPSDRLDRLLRAAGDLPLALAVIPDGDLASLERRLRAAPRVCVFQHGVDHRDVLSSPGAECEYPADVTASDVATRIAAARARMTGEGLSPVAYAPPWNRVDARLIEALPDAGFDVLSAGSQTPDAGGLKYLPTNLDILRWKGGPRFRGVGKVLRALRTRLATLRRCADFEAPTGLLTHHLDHDEAAWDFLAWFVLFAEDRFRWLEPPRAEDHLGVSA